MSTGTADRVARGLGAGILALATLGAVALAATERDLPEGASAPSAQGGLAAAPGAEPTTDGQAGDSGVTRLTPTDDQVAAFQELRRTFPFPPGARKVDPRIDFSGAPPQVGNYALARVVRSDLADVKAFYERELAQRGIGWEPTSIDGDVGTPYFWTGDLDLDSITELSFGGLDLESDYLDDPRVVTITVTLSL